MNTLKRNPAADIIRCLAFFFVVSVHFLWNNGFYNQPVMGKKMFVMVTMRALFIICVPLFLTLSGYLLRKKEPNKKYYLRVTNLLLTYFLSSIACVIYSICYLHYDMDIKTVIFNILNFSAAPYSWYIEMYLGLFLLIPFINILYNNISTKKLKLGLIITFLILTSLPSIFNAHNLDSSSWWLLPSESSETTKLIPSWWDNFYPLTYYLIGCYLSEYGFKINKTVNALLIVACTFLSGLYLYWRSYKSVFAWGIWCDYNSLFNVILTVLVFGLLINIDYSKVPQKLLLFIQKISGLSLSGYLVSWIFDSALYPELLLKVPSMPDRLKYYFLIVPVIYILSLILSYILNSIQKLLLLIIKKIAGLFRKKEAVAK